MTAVEQVERFTATAVAPRMPKAMGSTRTVSEALPLGSRLGLRRWLNPFNSIGPLCDDVGNGDLAQRNGHQHANPARDDTQPSEEGEGQIRTAGDEETLEVAPQGLEGWPRL